MDLFTHAADENPQGQPLAERLRPHKLEDMLGQAKIVGPKAPFRRLLESGQIPSLLLWGPPGSGKTTFALLLAQKVDAEFITVNAVETGAKALRELGDEGRRRRIERQRKTLLFVDEIHRLNKGQQDVLLPFVEKGDIILVGATTENPSYEINSALLSRTRLLVFERLGEKELEQLARRAAEEAGQTLENVLTDESLERLYEIADGDGRRLLNAMEIILNLKRAQPDTSSNENSASRPGFPKDSESGGRTAGSNPNERRESDDLEAQDIPRGKKLAPEAEGAEEPNRIEDSAEKRSEGIEQTEFSAANNHPEGTNLSDVVEDEAGTHIEARSEITWPMTPEGLAVVLDSPALRYDKTADEHYDTISAFIKSVRGSDPDAAVYYLARMIKGGEDPVFIARRLVILASEDIGNADPRGLSVAVAGLQAVELVGFPEAAISLAQVTTYLASAPKSNRSYMALRSAQELVEKTGTVPIPLSLRSAKTSSMKRLGYGKGYKYSHDGEKGYQPQRFLPEELGDVKLYEPSDRGFEKNIKQYLEWMKS